HDQVREALQGHESRHGGAHAKLSRFVIAGRQNTAPVARAAHAHWFAAQRRAIAHLYRSIKAIHIEMDNRARLLFALHTEISHNAPSRPSAVFTRQRQISDFAN